VADPEPVVDCHAHLLPQARMAKLIEWARRSNPAHPVPERVLLDNLVEEYARLGVAAVWNFAHAIFPEETEALNDWNWRLTRRHPRVIAFGTCHPQTTDPLAVIDRCFQEYGFPGIKFHPFIQRFTPWDKRHFPLYERIAAYGGIAVFHTGFEEFYGGVLPLAGFETVLRAFPTLLTVFAHANYPRVGQAFELVARYPNLYLDTVHVFAALSRTWEPGGDQAGAWAQLREGLRAFPERVMFGTDHPAGAGTLGEIYAEFRAFGLGPDLERALLGGTARRLMAQAPRAPREPARPVGS
jgi:predicted TIM-barrel fold metal-dependent hydrolase